MANGPRTVRQTGFKSPKGLDNLMKLLQTTGGIAQTVQQNSNNRDSTQASYLSALTRGYENIFTNDGSGGINNLLSKLESYKQNNLSNLTDDSIQLFDTVKMRLEKQKHDNSDFQINKNAMIQKTKDYQEFISDMFIYDSSNTTPQNKLEIREKLGKLKGKDYSNDEAQWKVDLDKHMSDMMLEYSSDFSNWYTRHPQRLTDGMVRGLSDTQNYMVAVLDGWRDDGKIDEAEKRFFYEGIMNGNSEQLQTFLAKRYIGDKNKLEIAYKGYNDQVANFKKIDEALRTGKMSYGDMKDFMTQDNLPTLQEAINQAQGQGDFMPSGTSKMDDKFMFNLNDDQKADLFVEIESSYDSILNINKDLMGLGQKDQLLNDSSFDSYLQGLSRPKAPPGPDMLWKFDYGKGWNKISTAQHAGKSQHETGDKDKWKGVTIALKKSDGTLYSPDEIEKDYPYMNVSGWDFIGSSRIDYAKNIQNLQDSKYNTNFVKPKIKKQTDHLSTLSNYSDDIRYEPLQKASGNTFYFENKEVKKLYDDAGFNLFRRGRRDSFAGTTYSKVAIKKYLINEGVREEGDRRPLSYKEYKFLQMKFEEEEAAIKNLEIQKEEIENEIGFWATKGGGHKYNQFMKTQEGQYYKELRNKVGAHNIKWGKGGNVNYEFIKEGATLGKNSHKVIEMGIKFFEQEFPLFYKSKEKELNDFILKQEKLSVNK